MNNLNQLIDYIFSNRLVLHVLYWTGFFILYCIYGLGYGQPLLVSVILKWTVFPAQIAAAYLFMYWQLPYLLNRKYIKFIVAFILCTYPIYLMVHLNYDLGIGRYLVTWHTPHSLMSIFVDLEFFFRYMVDVYMVVFVTASIKFIKDHLESRRLIEELESDMLDAEYRALHTRIQPQFILKSLQLIKESSVQNIEDTPELIANLSELIDDALREEDDHGLLKSEFSKLTNYIRLYAQASNDINNVHLDSNVSGSQLKIRSRILINIVEDIFRQLDKSSLEILDINILVLAENSKCILQLSFLTTEPLVFATDKIEDMLNITYFDNYNIEIFADDKSNDIQIAIDL